MDSTGSGLGPEAERAISPLFVGDDNHTPDQPESEGNSNTDPEDLAAGPMESKVSQFALVLREAQRVAVQLEKKEKKRKTYRGDSRTTQYRRVKARKALASQGFPDIASFFATPSEQTQGEHDTAGSPELEPESHGRRCEVDGRGGVPAPSKALGLAVDTVAERLNQNCRLVFAEEEEDSPASGSDLELGGNGGHGIPAPSKALRLAPLAVAGRPSQRQCLGFVEGVGDSPGLVRKSSGKPGETHWCSRVPSLTEALDCMPLAVARRQTCGQKEDRDEEEEDNNNTPENEVYRRGRIPAPPEMLDFMPMPLPISRRPTQGQKRRIVLEEEEEEEDNAPDTQSETHRGVPAPSEALGVTLLAIARRPTRGPKGRVVVMEEEEEEEDNDGAPEPAAATIESPEPPASGSELDAHMHGCTVAHLEATRTRPIQGIGDEESLLREHREGHWEGRGKARAGAPARAVDESTQSSVPPPSELE